MKKNEINNPGKITKQGCMNGGDTAGGGTAAFIFHLGHEDHLKSSDQRNGL
jgi:hypothetical protein